MKKKASDLLKQITADLNENQTLIYTFKHKLSTMSDSWKKNPSGTYTIDINGENLWFNTLLDKVNAWNEEKPKICTTRVIYG